MTRNEWIAETARAFAVHGRQTPSGRLAWEEFPKCIEAASRGADLLEASNVAPWQPPAAPPLTDAAAKVVEASIVYANRMTNENCDTWLDAVRAYKESIK